MSPGSNKVIIFDTTMRDGELMPGVTMNIQDKISIAKLLEAMGVDVIEVGYPGHQKKDFEEILNISKIIENSTICGLASLNKDEIFSVAGAIKLAKKGRINTYSLVNIKEQSRISKQQALAAIQDCVSLARDYCDDVQWSAFDATRAETDFLCKAIEVAINSGATTISIPDSLGVALPERFSQLIQTIFNQVPNIDKAIISVHCHDDLDKAGDNSLVALNHGVRQVECSINGLGARKGNADLEKVVMESKQENYQVEINTSLISTASKLVSKITKNEK